MSTPDSTARATTRGPKGGASNIATFLVAIALFVVAIALFSINSQAKYSACVEAQVAKYPAVGVSAFNTKTTGPIKVAYDAERRKAVEAC